MLKNLIFLLLLTPVTLFAQVTITGKVVSTDDKKPVPNASVFLSNASVGNQTGGDGSYTLYNVKNGQYDLVVTCVGYEAYHHTVMINNDALVLPPIELKTKNLVLNEVKVTFDPNRDRYVKLFLDEFFGHSDNAKECKLLNPEVLDVDLNKTTGILTASSTEFLIVENKALGYRVKYLLNKFSKDPRKGFVYYIGSSVFEPLKGSGSDEKRWKKARVKAYIGSDMHFLRSCIGEQVAEEGFTARRLIRKPNPDRPADSLITANIRKFMPHGGISFNNDSLRYWSEKSRLPKIVQFLVAQPLRPNEYIKRTNVKGIFAFGIDSCCLSIDHKKTGHNTVITFNTPEVYFDSNGIIINPESNTVEGYWASLRIAELLPVDYELPLAL